MQTEMLLSDVRSGSTLDAEEYLRGFQELTLQLNRAMEAIVVRSPSTFEDSLCRQRATCARMTDLSRRFAGKAVGESDLGVDSETVLLDEDLSTRIRAAATALHALNKRYASLLKHSGDTMLLFSRMFQSYSGPAKQADGSRMNLRTWSCEL